jgi:PKD repeat protein
MTIVNSTLTNNVGYYGGVANNGTLTVTKSTISGNEALVGGGISNIGAVTIKNCSVSSNTARAGGAIYNISGTITIRNTTIDGNSADSGGGICDEFGTTTLTNTIVASNTLTNCVGTILDGGHNIDLGDTCGFDPANNSMPNTDPLLGPLTDNGGDTWTHALLPGSPAIDAADPAFCPVTDQRGVSRPIDGDGDGEAVCDIGSYEFEFDPVQADFVGLPTTGLPPLAVTFTNTSTGDYEASLWTFGDGITSTLASPTHTYTAVGAYTVTLTVDGPGGTDTEVKERYITVQYGVYLPVILRSG